MSSTSAKTSVVISNLKRDVDKEALAALCSQLGRVVNFRLHTSGHDPDSTATAMVEYTSAEEAARVVGSVNGRLILGQPVTACVAISGKQYHQAPPAASLPPPATGSTQPSANPQPSTRLARATYPSGMEHRNMNPPAHDKNGGSPSTYTRYQPPDRTSSHEEPPRNSRAGAAPPTWERGGYGQQDHRISDERLPPPGASRYGETYGNSNHQAPQQHAWGGGRPRRDSGGDGVGAQPPPKYASERDDPYDTQQWEGQGEGAADDEEWEERGQYTAHQATRADPPAYRRQNSSGWPDERSPRGPPDERGPRGPPAGYGGGGGGQRPPVRHEVPRGPAGGRPHERRDDGYADAEVGDMIGSKRRLPLPPGSGRGGPAADGRSAWNESAEYSEAPRPAAAAAVPASSREDFDKEVVRQAALLVAERELRTRQESRQQVNVKNEWPEEPTPRRYEDRQGRERTNSGTAHSLTMDRRRTRSEEDADKRKREKGSRERRQRDPQGDRGRTADREKKWQHDTAEGSRDNKRARHENSLPRSGTGRTDERAGSGRANGRTDVRVDDRNATRMKHDVKRDDDARASKMPPRVEHRGIHRDVDRERRREDDSRKQREENRLRRDSRVLPSKTLTRERDTLATRTGGKSATWSATKRAEIAAEDERRARRVAADASAARDIAIGGSLSKNWETSTADTGCYVHVGGVSFSTTFTTLAKRFGAFGDVNGFKVIFNNVTCRSQTSESGGSSRKKEEAIKPAVVTASTGFAFISFDNEEGMEKAIAGMDNQVLDGHLLKVSRGRIPAKLGSHQRAHPEFSVHARQRGVGGGGTKTVRRWPAPKGGKQGGTAAHAPHQDDKKKTEKHENGDRYDKADGSSIRDRAAPVSPAASAAAASIVAAAAAAASLSSPSAASIVAAAAAAASLCSPSKTLLKRSRGEGTSREGTAADGGSQAAIEKTRTDTAITVGPALAPTAASASSPNALAHVPVKFEDPNGGGKVSSPLLLRGSARRTRKSSGANFAAAAAAAAVSLSTAATATSDAGDKVNPKTAGKGGGYGGGNTDGGSAADAAGDITKATNKESKVAERRSTRVVAASKNNDQV